MKKYIVPIISFLLLIGIDQWSKFLAYTTLRGGDSFSVLGDVFVLQYLENRGAAFGMLQNQRIFLVSLTVLILAAVLIFYMKLPSKPKLTPLRCSAVLLAAGAVGNLSDRIVRGYVIDFFYVKIINFPIFNVADCYVVVAAILTALLIGFYYKDEDFQ